MVVSAPTSAHLTESMTLSVPDVWAVSGVETEVSWTGWGPGDKVADREVAGDGKLLRAIATPEGGAPAEVEAAKGETPIVVEEG